MLTVVYIIITCTIIIYCIPTTAVISYPGNLLQNSIYFLWFLSYRKMYNYLIIKLTMLCILCIYTIYIMDFDYQFILPI